MRRCGAGRSARSPARPRPWLPSRPRAAGCRRRPTVTTCRVPSTSTSSTRVVAPSAARIRRTSTGVLVSRRSRAAGAQHPATYGRLQPGLLLLRARCRTRPRRAARRSAGSRRAARTARWPARRRPEDAPARPQGRRPPSFAPQQQLLRVAGASGVPGRQCRELGAVDARPGPHLGGAHRQPVLVEHVQPAPAGGQHRARVAAGLGLQCAGQPSGGPRDRGTAPRRALAAASRCWSASSPSPTASAMRPASNRASVDSGSRSSWSCSARPLPRAAWPRSLAGHPAGEQLRALGAQQPRSRPCWRNSRAGGPGVVDRASTVARGQARAGGDQERLGVDVARRAVLPARMIHGLPSVAASIIRHAGGQQQPATVEIELRGTAFDGGRTSPRPRRSGAVPTEVTRAEREVAAVVPRHTDSSCWPACRNSSSLRARSLSVRRAVAELVVDQRPPVECSSLVDEVAGCVTRGWPGAGHRARRRRGRGSAAPRRAHPATEPHRPRTTADGSVECLRVRRGCGPTCASVAPSVAVRRRSDQARPLRSAARNARRANRSASGRWPVRDGRRSRPATHRTSRRRPDASASDRLAPAKASEGATWPVGAILAGNCITAVVSGPLLCVGHALDRRDHPAGALQSAVRSGCHMATERQRRNGGGQVRGRGRPRARTPTTTSPSGRPTGGTGRIYDYLYRKGQYLVADRDLERATRLLGEVPRSSTTCWSA